MNIGIVTTWFERGASYVSRLYMNIIETHPDFNVFIYARGGEDYAKGNSNWDGPNVEWGKKIVSPFSSTVIAKKDFIKWLTEKKIDVVLFNEQHWFQPILWCKDLGIKTMAYIDYYTEETVPLFEAYDLLICNTRRHFSAFERYDNAVYLPWGTDIETFKPTSKGLVNNDMVTFFHSCGWDIRRKGTDLLLLAFANTKNKSKLIVHSQNPIDKPELQATIKKLREENRLEIIVKTVHAPGLYHLGDIYVYPTRLEGIGLTIPEAISSGLGVIVPNNPPMNEFYTPEIGALVKVDRFTARSDGYYWPKCKVDIADLTKILDNFAENIDEVGKMKDKARKFAIESLDVNKNFSNLNNIIEKLVFKNISPEIRGRIKKYDKKGMKRFNDIYLKYYLILNPLRKILK